MTDRLMNYEVEKTLLDKRKTSLVYNHYNLKVEPAPMTITIPRIKRTYIKLQIKTPKIPLIIMLINSNYHPLRRN